MNRYNDEQAKREGWAVFECDTGKLRIMRLDSPVDAFPDLPPDPMIASDQLAIQLVRKRAREGSACHIAAAGFHGRRYLDRNWKRIL